MPLDDTTGKYLDRVVGFVYQYPLRKIRIVSFSGYAVHSGALRGINISLSFGYHYEDVEENIFNAFSCEQGHVFMDWYHFVEDVCHMTKYTLKAEAEKFTISLTYEDGFGRKGWTANLLDALQSWKVPESELKRLYRR